MVRNLNTIIPFLGSKNDLHIGLANVGIYCFWRYKSSDRNNYHSGPSGLQGGGWLPNMSRKSLSFVFSSRSERPICLVSVLGFLQLTVMDSTLLIYVCVSLCRSVCLYVYICTFHAFSTSWFFFPK